MIFPKSQVRKPFENTLVYQSIVKTPFGKNELPGKFFLSAVHSWRNCILPEGCGKAGGVVRNFVNKAEINNMKQFCINVFVYLCNFAKQACLNKNG